MYKSALCYSFYKTFCLFCFVTYASEINLKNSSLPKSVPIIFLQGGKDCCTVITLTEYLEFTSKHPHGSSQPHNPSSESYFQPIKSQFIFFNIQTVALQSPASPLAQKIGTIKNPKLEQGFKQTQLRNGWKTSPGQPLYCNNRNKINLDTSAMRDHSLSHFHALLEYLLKKT